MHSLTLLEPRVSHLDASIERVGRVGGERLEVDHDGWRRQRGSSLQADGELMPGVRAVQTVPLVVLSAVGFARPEDHGKGLLELLKAGRIAFVVTS